MNNPVLMKDQNKSNGKNLNTDADDVIHTFQVNFFSMGLLNTFPWDSLDREHMTSQTCSVFLDVLKQTCLHPICLKNPPSVKYRKRFLQELIKRHEMLTDEPLDELYEALGDVMCARENELCYKTYILPTGGAVSLAESVAVISAGTTGLVTWEAALYLAEWALENPEVFKSKQVLELGSGVGLTGIVVCQTCRPDKYIFTDCHHAVLQRLKDNIANNLTHSDDDGVCVEELDWETVSDEQLLQIQAHTIIAADVVYDPYIIQCLVKLLRRFLRCEVETHREVYIASTVRNPQTYSGFKKELDKSGLRHAIIKDPVTQVFHYNRVSHIEMIKIYV